MRSRMVSFDPNAEKKLTSHLVNSEKFKIIRKIKIGIISISCDGGGAPQLVASRTAAIL